MDTTKILMPLRMNGATPSDDLKAIWREKGRFYVTATWAHRQDWADEYSIVERSERSEWGKAPLSVKVYLPKVEADSLCAVMNRDYVTE